MASKARNYSNKTLKRLFGLSGNECAFPGCGEQMVNKSNAKSSNICHIEAANIGGERYNEDMTDEERADYPNLILLCVQHHDETNDVEKYTTPILVKMKREHEAMLLNSRITHNPSMLVNTINAIADISFDDIIESGTLTVFDPKLKIKYNFLKRNIALINEYKIYSGKVNNLYDELEIQGSIKKEKLLSNIRRIYINVKGTYVLDNDNELEMIQNNSDDIFDDVYDELYKETEGSRHSKEDLAMGIQLIMVDAFLRCKILEEPQ